MPMTMSAHQGEYGSQVKLMIADITAMTMPAHASPALTLQQGDADCQKP